MTSLLRDWMARGLLRPRPVVTLARLLGAFFEEAGALLGTATDRAHVRTQIDALLGDWLAGIRREPGERANVLATDRLVLEPCSAADVPELASLFAKEKVRRLRDGSERRFSQGLLGIYLARDGRRAPIGAAGFAALDDRGTEELVVAVDPAFRRRGYGYELAEVVLREASVRGSSNIRASAGHCDVASARLLEKLGFVRWAKRGEVVEYVRAG